jgi:hypothetical protein
MCIYWRAILYSFKADTFSAVILEQNTTISLVAQEKHVYKSGEFNIYIFTHETKTKCFSSARYTLLKWERYTILTHSAELLPTHITQQ